MYVGADHHQRVPVGARIQHLETASTSHQRKQHQPSRTVSVSRAVEKHTDISDGASRIGNADGRLSPHAEVEVIAKPFSREGGKGSRRLRQQRIDCFQAVTLEAASTPSIACERITGRERADVKPQREGSSLVGTRLAAFVGQERDGQRQQVSSEDADPTPLIAHDGLPCTKLDESHRLQGIIELLEASRSSKFATWLLTRQPDHRAREHAPATSYLRHQFATTNARGTPPRS
jgi:hypothetical protein